MEIYLMNNIRAAVAPFAQSVGFYLNKGFESVQQLPRMIGTIPSEMHKNQSAAVTVFAVSNLAIFILSSQFTNYCDRHIEHHPDPLSKEQKAIKPLVLNGIFAAAVFGLNVGFSKIVGFPLSTLALTAISITAVAARIILNWNASSIDEKNTVSKDDLLLDEMPEEMDENEKSQDTIDRKNEKETEIEKLKATLLLTNKQVSDHSSMIETLQTEIEKKEQLITQLQEQDVTNKDKITQLTLDLSNARLHENDVNQAQEEINTRKTREQELKSQLTIAQERLQEIQKENNTKKAHEQELESQLTIAQERLQEIQKENNTIKTELVTSKECSDAYQKDIQKMSEKIKNLNSTISQQKQEITGLKKKYVEPSTSNDVENPISSQPTITQTPQNKNQKKKR